jgi:hypothetical protein
MFRRARAAAGRRRGASLPVLALSVLSAACGTDELVEQTFVDPTEIAVDPSDFLGDVSCSAYPGAMKAYVMTLVAWDGPNDTSPFVVGSSRPTSCAFVTGFRNVIIEGERYTAFVDGYDVGPDELSPFGGSSSGARQMRDRSSGQVVEPRWTTQCGGGPSTAAIAQMDRRIYVRPCDALEVGDQSSTQLQFSPSLVLGDDPCSVAPSVDLTFETGGLPTTLGLACDAEPLVYDVSPGTYQIYVRAEVDGEPRGSTCIATVSEGTVTNPTCPSLSGLGTVRLDVAGVLDEADEPVCPSGASFDVFDVDEALNAIPLPCGAPAQLGPFESGIRTFDVTVYDGEGGSQPGAATCAADIEPGRLVNAVCVP